MDGRTGVTNNKTEEGRTGGRTDGRRKGRSTRYSAGFWLKDPMLSSSPVTSSDRHAALLVVWSVLLNFWQELSTLVTRFGKSTASTWPTSRWRICRPFWCVVVGVFSRVRRRYSCTRSHILPFCSQREASGNVTFKIVPGSRLENQASEVCVMTVVPLDVESRK